jgi:hypothetical protein
MLNNSPNPGTYLHVFLSLNIRHKLIAYQGIFSLISNTGLLFFLIVFFLSLLHDTANNIAKLQIITFLKYISECLGYKIFVKINWNSTT